MQRASTASYRESTVHVRDLHPWPATVAEAQAVADSLRPLVVADADPGMPPGVVAGVDVAYGDDDQLAAAVVALDYRTLTPVASAVAVGRATFPYVPGLFAFRELPTLVTALRRLDVTPDLLVCDGYGLAHPRRFGLACHLGVLTDLPTIGVGKTAFVGRYDDPGPARGEESPLWMGEERVGTVLRTRDRVKPVFVSVGHRSSLPAATAHVLHLTPRYRLPETTRAADHLARRTLSTVEQRDRQ